MPLPLAGLAIAGAMGVISGRLVKEGIETHKKMQEVERKYVANSPRTTGGVTPTTKTVNKLYRPSK